MLNRAKQSGLFANRQNSLQTRGGTEETIYTGTSNDNITRSTPNSLDYTLKFFFYIIPIHTQEYDAFNLGEPIPLNSPKDSSEGIYCGTSPAYIPSDNPVYKIPDKHPTSYNDGSTPEYCPGSPTASDRTYEFQQPEAQNDQNRKGKEKATDEQLRQWHQSSSFESPSYTTSQEIHNQQIATDRDYAQNLAANLSNFDQQASLESSQTNISESSKAAKKHSYKARIAPYTLKWDHTTRTEGGKSASKVEGGRKSHEKWKAESIVKYDFMMSRNRINSSAYRNANDKDRAILRTLIMKSGNQCGEKWLLKKKKKQRGKLRKKSKKQAD